MHDTDTAPGVPGQSGSSTVYAGQLEAIVLRLLAYVAEFPATKLLYISTTSYNCDAVIDASIQTLNAQAAALMREYGIQYLDVYSAIRTECGGTPPTAGCENEPSWGSTCFCPHCPPGYSWLVNSTILPAVQHALGL